MWDLSTLTGYQTCIPCVGRWSLNHLAKSQRTLPDPVQFSPVTQLCPALFDPTDCSTPGFPVHYQLPEPAQTPVHQVSDATQAAYPLPSPSPTFNLSQHQVFSSESVLCIRWPKYWSFNFNICPSNEYSELILFRLTGWISLQSKGLSRDFSNTTRWSRPSPRKINA